MAPKDNIKQLRHEYGFTENLLISGLMLSMVIMVLKFKFKWFRARLKFDDTRTAPIQTSSGVYRQSIDPEFSSGVYRQSTDPELSWNYNGTANHTISNPIRPKSKPQESIDSNEPEYLNEIPQASLNNEYLTLTDANDLEKLPELLETRPIFETVQTQPKLPKVERFEDDFKITVDKPKLEPRTKFLEIQTKPKLIRTESFEYDDFVVEPQVRSIPKVPSFEYDEFKIVEPKVRPISKVPSIEHDDFKIESKARPISKIPSFENDDFEISKTEPKSIKVQTFDDFKTSEIKPRVKFLETLDDDFEVVENSKYQNLATKRNSDFMVNRSDLIQQEYSNAAANIFLRNQNQSKGRVSIHESRTTSLARPSVITSQSPVAKQKSPEKSYKQKSAAARTKVTINQASEPRPTASISRISSRPITLGSSDDNLSISSQTSA